MKFAIQDLLPFCGADDARPLLKKPWIYKGHTYATDGRVCIRVDGLVEGAESWNDDARSLSHQIDCFINCTDNLKFEPIPLIPNHKLEKCLHCKDGICHEPFCCGEAEKATCYYCGGTQKRRKDKAVCILGAVFNPYYLSKLKGVGAEIAVRKPTEFALFRGSRFFGAIMPMRDTHVGKWVDSPVG